MTPPEPTPQDYDAHPDVQLEKLACWLYDQGREDWCNLVRGVCIQPAASSPAPAEPQGDSWRDAMQKDLDALSAVLFEEGRKDASDLIQDTKDELDRLSAAEGTSEALAGHLAATAEKLPAVERERDALYDKRDELGRKLREQRERAERAEEQRDMLSHRADWINPADYRADHNELVEQVRTLRAKLEGLASDAESAMHDDGDGRLDAWAVAQECRAALREKPE